MKELKARGPVQPSTPLDRALIPDAILKDPSLSAGARLFLVLVAEYQGKRLECFPPETTLAGWLGVKLRQLKNYIKELANYTRGDPPEPSPLVEVKRVLVENDGKTRNIYKLLWPFPAVSRDPNRATEPQPADRGDAQYFADASEGSPQCTAAASPDGIPPGDTQSLAHRSGSGSGAEEASLADGGDAQYFADASEGSTQKCTDAAAFPSEDACAVTDGPPPCDAQFFTHRSMADAQTSPRAPASPTTPREW
jgi:hypothetical protein